MDRWSEIDTSGRLAEGGTRVAMGLADSLDALAEQTHYGVAFLLAYGTTWIICGGLWRRVSARGAALAVLFQGMVAFPAAIGLSYLIGALGDERPVEDLITQLSVYIGTSQLLGLPLLIYLYAQRQFTLMPYAFAAICAMHFMLYSWLYQTPLYVVMSVAIALGGFRIMALDRNRSPADSVASPRAASSVCFFTGAAMLVVSVMLGIKSL